MASFAYAGRLRRERLPESSIAVPCFGYSAHAGLFAAACYAFRYAFCRSLTIYEAAELEEVVVSLPLFKVQAYKKDHYFTFLVNLKG